MLQLVLYSNLAETFTLHGSNIAPSDLNALPPSASLCLDPDLEILAKGSGRECLSVDLESMARRVELT